MYRFGNTESSPQSKLDFDVLFGREDLTTEVLLSTTDIIDEVRMSNDSFSGHLKKREDMTRELMDYAVQPERQQQRKGAFPVTYPFTAIELLCGQNEQFLDFILGIRKEQKPENSDSDSTTITETPPEEKINPTPDTDCPLSHIFKFLETEHRVNETACGYLLRFLSQVQYLRGTELFRFFEAHPQIITNILRHCYSKSLTDAISKLLCVEQQEVSPAAMQLNEAKERLIGRLFESFASETRERQLGERLENFVFMIEDITERCQDRYEGVKFTTLLGRAISLMNIQSLNEVLLKNSDSELVLLPGLDVLTMFLAFYKADRVKQSRKNNSEGSDIKEQATMVAEETDSSIINNEVLLAIERLASQLLQKFEGKELNIDWSKQELPLQENGSDHKMIEQPPMDSPSKPQPANEQPADLITPEKASSNMSESLLLEQTPTKPKFKFSQLKLFIIVQDLIILESKNSNFEEELLTVAFVRYAVNLIQQHPRNNLMHNTLKNILVKGIKGKGHTARIICSKQAGLLAFIVDTVKAGCSFTNQLHHISTAVEEVRKKDTELEQATTTDSNHQSNAAPTWDAYIKGHYSDTIKAHSRLLGGEDPKKKSQICMIGFYNRPGKTITATKEEVEEVKYHTAGPDKGEMGDENEEQVENLCLGIDSDEEKKLRPKQSASKMKRGLALCALMTRDEVKSEDDDTVRVDEDINSVAMEIQIIAQIQQPTKSEAVQSIPPNEQDVPAEPLIPEPTSIIIQEPPALTVEQETIPAPATSEL